MKKIYVLLLAGFCFQSIFAQKEGYWDKDRAMTKEIIVPAHDRVVVKTDDLPEGTTELIFRITLLDENQQMSGNLISLLKSVPDPTGITKGAAGAVFIVSKISGDDKCKYALFTTEKDGAKYQSTGNTALACLSQDTPVSKDAKRLFIDNSSCLQSNTKNIWIGFESTNWVMKQKIILEIVPWVDNKLSRGWTVENRKLIINQCKTSTLAQKMTNSDDFAICLQEKIQKRFRFQEFQKLLTIEQNKFYKDFGNACFSETSVSKTVYSDLRNAANEAIKKDDFKTAIQNYTTIVKDQQATAVDYAITGYCYLLTKQYTKALQILKNAEKVDETELLVKINLAHAYLLNGDYSEAKSIYKNYQTQNINANTAWTQKVKDDFELFQKKGITNDDFDRVLKLFR